MNSIRSTRALNKRELESAVPPSASWHADYRDTAWLYVGGFPFDLSEGDLVTIFSQYGNPTHLNLIRDRETGKSKGFAFLKYEDQRSCDLAVDNLGGAEVLGRMLRVDHTRYKKREDEDEETWRIERLEGEEEGVNGNGKRASDGEETNDEGKRKRRKRAMIKEERELEELMRIKEGEEEDPMRRYLIEEKRGEVEKALARIEKKEKHHRKHRRDRDGDRERDEERKLRSHRDRDDEEDERRHRQHHHRDRKHRGEEEDRASRSHRHKRASDHERSRSRSRSRHRSDQRSLDPSTKRQDSKYSGQAFRRRGHGRTPSRSRSRSQSRERKRCER
jgi:RNA-binding motif protein, X-linked 2